MQRHSMVVAQEDFLYPTCMHSQARRLALLDAQDAFDMSNLEQTDSPSLVAAVP